MDAPPRRCILSMTTPHSNVVFDSSLPTLVSFTHRLRDAGIPVAAGIAGQMVEALSTVGMAEGEDAYYAMRSLACSSLDHLVVFDKVFLGFFGDRMNSVVTATGRSSPRRAKATGWMSRALPGLSRRRQSSGSVTAISPS